MRSITLRRLALMAVLLAPAGRALAAAPLVTTPVDIDAGGYQMYCDATNVGPVPVTVTVEFCDISGAVQDTWSDWELTPGAGEGFAAPLGKGVWYCRVIVAGGNPKNVRATAVFMKSGRYLASADAR